MARLIWAQQALDDFERLLEYIAKDSPLAARRFGEKLIARVELLQSYPEIGGWVLEDRSRRYREILQGNYRVIYRTDENVVYLVAVYHAARLLNVDDID